MSKKMDREEIVRHFKGDIHCSQLVMKQWAEDMGYNVEDAMRMTAALGGGCIRGDVCGTVASAMVIIGMKYGHCEVGDKEGNARMMQKAAEFQKKFIEKHGTVICRDLTGFDFSKDGELQRAIESGKLHEICPDYVNTAIGILEEIM